MRARLDVVEGNFRDHFGPHVHRVRVAADFQLQEFLRLPRQHPIREPLERLAQHDEPAALGIACAEVQVAERALTAAAAPLGGEDDEVERPRLLDLQPCLAAAAGSVHAVHRFRHHSFVTGCECLIGELLRCVGA